MDVYHFERQATFKQLFEITFAKLEYHIDFVEVSIFFVIVAVFGGGYKHVHKFDDKWVPQLSENYEFSENSLAVDWISEDV